MGERDAVLREVRQLDYVWIPLRDGTRLAARVWLPGGRRSRPRAGHPRGRALPAQRRHGHPRRRSSTRTGPARGYACVRVDLRGSGESDGVLEDEYHAAGAGGPARGHRLDRRAAVVHRRRRHDGHLVGRLQQPPAGRPPAAGAQGDHHADEHRRPLRRRRALQGRLRAGAPTCCTGARACCTGSASRRTRPRSASAGASSGSSGSRRNSLDPHLARAPAPRRLLEARLGVRGLRRHRHAPSTPSAAGPTATPTRACACSRGCRGPRKGLIGPWPHAFPALRRPPGPAIGFLQEALRWWDHWLKGVDTGVMDEPMLRVWMQDSVAAGAAGSTRCRGAGWPRTCGRRRASSPRCGWTPTACCATPRRGAGRRGGRRARRGRRPPRASAAPSSAAPTPAPGAPRASRATSPPTSARRRAVARASPRRRWPSRSRSSATRGDAPLRRATGRWRWSPRGWTTWRRAALSKLVTTQVFNLTHRDGHEHPERPRAGPAIRRSTVRARRDRPRLPGRPPAARRRLADLLAVGVAVAGAGHAQRVRRRRACSSCRCGRRGPRTRTLPAVRARRSSPEALGEKTIGGGPGGRTYDPRPRHRRRHLDVPLRRRRQRRPRPTAGRARSGTR